MTEIYVDNMEMLTAKSSVRSLEDAGGAKTSTEDAVKDDNAETDAPF